MNDSKDNQLKAQKIYTQTLEDKPRMHTSELTIQRQFDDKDTFITAKEQVDEANVDIEKNLERIIQPPKRKRFLAGGLLSVFTVLIAWQSIDSLYTSIQMDDWLSVGWAGFVAILASLGVIAIGKELWLLKRLRQQLSTQDKAECLITNNSVGEGKVFCQSLAKRARVAPTSPSYVRWQQALNESHSDSEIIEMYDAIVVGEQDKEATKIVTQYSTESAALVAISPLAVADMLLVAWRSFKMIDSLAEIYGVELGYLSRLKLFKSILINMALVGVSELAIDASVDLLSMDLAGKISARAGQGLGVGILTARLGLKAMALLRPTTWHSERQVKLGAIRKRIVEKIAALTIK
ncbi:YcjF family protein [Vibrio pectenicida]|uniref:TIGR01620 family protein n=1 Tax=Vibrio pectenicida TaxID=62763 RepID=A0A3R9FAI6_9VIBR|nr:TIGR01620 family protein [Vibrio pectenicida]RSD32564.1 TIGR01620 family protein [Vibrio pectenicida]